MNNNEKPIRQFIGVWIPADIWIDRDLSLNEKAILTEINSFSGEDGCFASNQHFADFIDLSPNRCSTIITGLEKKGKIEITYTYQPGTKRIAKRYLKMVNEFNRETPSVYGSTPSVDETTPSISEVTPSVFGKTPSGNSKGTNTSNTNTSNTNTKEKDFIPYFKIIEYLNFKTGKNFKDAQAHKAHIKSRWNEGYRLEDFKKVIDIKTKTWLNDSFGDQFLRPRTLFGPKFDDYLNETEVTNKPSFKNGGIRSEVVMPAYTKQVEADDPEELEQLRKDLMEGKPNGS